MGLYDTKQQRDEQRTAFYEANRTEPPSHLSERSKELWKECNPYHVRSMERLAVLQAALEALDRADAARLGIADQGMITVTARSGVSHVNPLVKVEREARRSLPVCGSKLAYRNWKSACR